MSRSLTMYDRAPVDETRSLLSDHARRESTHQNYEAPAISPPPDSISHFAVLPLALLAALAMAATAATTLFAYATLLCEDPTHCKNSERNIYAGSVAVAACFASVCSLLALGSLGRLSKMNHTAGLALWLVCRSMSVVMLALGSE